MPFHFFLVHDVFHKFFLACLAACASVTGSQSSLPHYPRDRITFVCNSSAITLNHLKSLGLGSRPTYNRLSHLIDPVRLGLLGLAHFKGTRRQVKTPPPPKKKTHIDPGSKSQRARSKTSRLHSPLLPPIKIITIRYHHFASMPHYHT
ncbi:hypothetical protein F5Y11DRAFT_201976 [Daldinia sp. FL1419]|nr:hypothetical protein F5Y11DRAFT_201976 [Daldinia sp. FL1419]